MGLAAVVAALGLLGSCAGSRPTLGAIPPRTTTTTTTTVPTTAGSTTSAVPVVHVLGPADLLGFIATPKGAPVVYAEPNADAAKIDIPSKTEAGAPTTFAIVGDAAPSAVLAHPGWLEVALPTRPNGGTAWVESNTVAVSKTGLRVFVDLPARNIRVEDGGKQVFDAKVAIGTTDNPTPTGATFVTELIQNQKPAGSYGPYAFGLALHSNTLTEFQGGDGQVGIHGTNHPELIGDRVSHGCVRLNNADVTKLVDLQLPLGVPVFIT
ncbi:MAG: ErfK/YbiS/YcfS/YnhG family protein [Acidimicrobiales bacterium]|nr:ErfK/YbiS/YcfS/YnhG family protein [Acidimicrobiales bacterium]